MNTSSITRFANRSVLKVKKNSPQILFVAGIVGTVATTVMASRATLKAQPIVKDHIATREFIDGSRLEKSIDEKEYTHLVVQQYTVTSMKLVRLYGPTVVVGVGSIAALTKSHRQLTNRNQALTIAFTGLYKTFENYRERVRAELGVDQDQRFLHGTITEQMEIEGKNGKTTVKSITSLDPDSTASYSLYFDDSIPTWTKDPGYNQNMIGGQEEWANVKLRLQGHLLLNDVYDLLKAPRTKEGAIVGWIHKDLGPEVGNDSFVDFGHRLDSDFMGGYKRDVMLTFNPMGPILDLI